MADPEEAALTSLHPWAWWCWAIGIGIAVSGTTNPLFLALIATAMVAVVMVRRSDAPWARSVRAYLLLSLFVIGMRLFFQMILGGGRGETVLFTLPSVPLPEWAAGIQLGGTVTAEALASSLYDALRLAVMLLCIGAANALANPRQALRSVPAALYEASVAVVIALSVAPQLIESVQRVRRARRLRGDSSTSLRALGTIAMPVLADAIERSMSLAAGMEARGFARTRGLPVKGTLPVMLVSSMVATGGVFLLLSTSFRIPALWFLAVGVTGCAVALRAAGRRLRVTAYRPHPWRTRETLVATTGILAAVVVLGLGWVDPDTLSPALAALLDPGALTPSTWPLVWPQLTAPMLLVVALVLAPIPLTRPRRRSETASTRNDTRVRSLRPRAAEPEPEPAWR
ncbi:MAG: energy-coupling factor transporter transmembrane component T [Propionicimonas sp.]|uniref:energy-coupling factor transporter transmembrane component T n=1 Tax=Propionicimonas sp. TaxID=1955623 RepID=UPI003D11D0FF